MLSEAVARKIIGVQGAEVILSIIDGAWSDHIAEGRLRKPWTRASIVWDYMESRAEEAFAGADGVRQVTREQRSMFVLRDRFLLRFKKHTRELQTRNYRTPAQQRVAVQGSFDDFPALPAISCGYVLDQAEAGIESFVVVNRIDGWSIDLRELAAGEMRPTTQLLDFAAYNENPDLFESISWLNAADGS